MRPRSAACTSGGGRIRHVTREADVAVVEPDDVQAVPGERDAELIGPRQHLRPQAHDQQHGRRFRLAELLERDVDARGPDAAGDLHAQVCATGSSMLISGRW